MTEEQLKKGTKRMAVSVAKTVGTLPRTLTADIYGKQAIRSSSSVACNYRAACRARSDAEMAAKLGIAEEEADESQYWLEMLVESEDLKVAVARPIHKELNEIVAILVASRKTLRKRITEQGSVIREERATYETEELQAKSPSKKLKARSSVKRKSSNRQSNIEQ